MIYISFCITVYNQYDLVKACVESILPCASKEIEIVINDDCSTEDIQGLVESWHDDRVRYYRNNSNLGHDLNILKSCENAQGKYIFLLRSRDNIIPSGIETMLSWIKNDPDIVYMTGSAIDECGKDRIRYEQDLLSISSKENRKLNHSLYVHPSGFMFRKETDILVAIRRFLIENTDDGFVRLSFISHVLLRLALVERGKFLLVKETLWLYTHTEKAKDIAQNKANSGISVYAPEFILKRHALLMKWIYRTVPNIYQFEEYKNAFLNLLTACTIGLYERNRSKELQKHYGYKPITYNVRNERRNCVRFNREVAKTLGIYTLRYAVMCKTYILLNVIHWTVHYWKRRIRKEYYERHGKQKNRKKRSSEYS